MKVGLYLHFPYCRSRCTYCDFNAYTDPGAEARATYARDLCLDISRQERFRIETVFCGGGTPSLQSPDEMAMIFEQCRRSFDFAPTEVTLEANPGTVTLDGLRRLREVGFNRLSLGVQTFESGLLTQLNRIHSASEVEQAVSWAREAGFSNLSLDLIYGLPDQSLASWQDTVERALGLEPDHLSVYQLSVEQGTHLAAQIRKRELALPPEGRTWKMDQWMRRRLRSSGLRRYEVSNWALPGRESLHNLIYWRDLPYLGLGCGATGFIGGWRQRRVLHPHAYGRFLAEGAVPLIHAERRDAEGALRDLLFMGLRVREGVSWRRLRGRFPTLQQKALEDFFQSFPSTWVQLSSRRVRLTFRGLNFVSSICEAMLDVLLLPTTAGNSAQAGRAEEASALPA